MAPFRKRNPSKLLEYASKGFGRTHNNKFKAINERSKKVDLKLNSFSERIFALVRRGTICSVLEEESILKDAKNLFLEMDSHAMALPQIRGKKFSTRYNSSEIFSNNELHGVETIRDYAQKCILLLEQKGIITEGSFKKIFKLDK
ncbi:MAG: hypothetical protein WC915_00120 [archaeon]|jgi:hypothetical protein